MARNIELLTKVRDLVKTEPERLDMDLWGAVKVAEEFIGKDKVKVSCGTTACIAGWAVQLGGDQLLLRADYLDGGDVGDTVDVDECVANNGRVMYIDDRAQKLLGLSDNEREMLFQCTNSQALPYLDDLIAGEDISDDRDW